MNKKNLLSIIVFVLFSFPSFCSAAELNTIKADFLAGNYRRVIFEGQVKIKKFNFDSSLELNYILGLSYLKEGNLVAAEESFKRVIKDARGQLNTQGRLGLADTYLIGGQLQDAEDIYNEIIIDQANTSLKAAVLYRQSQLEFKKGDNSKGNEYLLKLKKDFPLSPELKLSSGIPRVYSSSQKNKEYSVQVGFFTNSQNANSFKSKLLDRDFPAYLEQVNNGWRVKVGRFKSVQEAIDLESKLSQEGFPTKICP
ncbi:MAG: SPOR domain-containing protein [Candidatus Omnitrophota bacterium]